MIDMTSNARWRSLLPLGLWLRVRGLQIADEGRRLALNDGCATDDFQCELTFKDGDSSSMVLIVTTSGISERLPLRELP